MSLRRIALRDFVIVPSLDLELAAGFGVLTGETGAGKSILIDALQLALASRPATISIAISLCEGSTTGRLDSVCGAIGTITQPPMSGCMSGPPADRA